MAAVFRHDAEIRNAQCPPGRDKVYLVDNVEEGLRLYLHASGLRRWALYYRFMGAQKLANLGHYPDVSLLEARAKAHDLRKGVKDPDNPVDPLAERQRKREAPTVVELARDYLERYARLKQRSHATTESRLRRFVLGGAPVEDDQEPIEDDPAGLDWSREKAAAITHADIATLHRRIGAGHAGAPARPYEANRVRRLLRSMFGKAAKWGYREAGQPNPAEDIDEFDEEERDRWLDADEMKRLIRALDDYTGWPETLTDKIVDVLAEAGSLRAADVASKIGHPVDKTAQLLSHISGHDPRVERVQRGVYRHTGIDSPALAPKPEAHIARAAIWTIVVTGARKREILGARLVDMNFERGALYLPAKRTKGKKRETKALPGAIVDLLRTVPRPAGCPFVFPSLVGVGHEGHTWAALQDIRRPWEAIRSAAKLEDVSIHDMRRTWASWQASAGESIYTVSKVLGHSSVRVTEKVYAFVADEPKRAAVERYTRAVQAAAYGEGEGSGAGAGVDQEPVDLVARGRRRR